MALTRCAAVKAAEFGVRVNAVAPSLALHANLAKVTSDELLAELTAREAFGRAAQPWEIANAIVFLASGYSSYLTGRWSPSRPDTLEGARMSGQATSRRPGTPADPRTS